MNTKTRFRTVSTDQSSRTPPHRKKCTHTANCFIGRHPGTSSTFTKGPVSSRTMRTSLAEGNLGSWPPLRVLPLTPPINASVLIGAVHEETRLQRNGTRSSLATNPDLISALMTIVFVCGDPVVNASFLPLIYSDTSLHNLV
ncbi:HTH_Tnp_Tc3_2 domain-containing protein [Trichonephila clavipes]|nr:HTH_Tnp_Tc3_2 domain-containing protein [Trichonephila clavipes]